MGESPDLPLNVYKVETRKFPLLGIIAAGEPILAEEELECYIKVGTNIKADFC